MVIKWEIDFGCPRCLDQLNECREIYRKNEGVISMRKFRNNLLSLYQRTLLEPKQKMLEDDDDTDNVQKNKEYFLIEIVKRRS